MSSSLAYCLVYPESAGHGPAHSQKAADGPQSSRPHSQTARSTLSTCQRGAGAGHSGPCGSSGTSVCPGKGRPTKESLSYKCVQAADTWFGHNRIAKRSLQPWQPEFSVVGFSPRPPPTREWKGSWWGGADLTLFTQKAQICIQYLRRLKCRGRGVLKKNRLTRLGGHCEERLRKAVETACAAAALHSPRLPSSSSAPRGHVTAPDRVRGPPTRAKVSFVFSCSQTFFCILHSVTY